MNDETPEPFDTVGDEPVEARIVAWVLGEASAFEAAELERLCEEKPELLVFRRRMRALHGLLSEAEASETDNSWKLPPEKRKVLDDIFGEEKPIRLEVDRKDSSSWSGRRMLLAIAACLVLGVMLMKLYPRGYESQAIIEVKSRTVGKNFGKADDSKVAAVDVRGEFEKIKSSNSLAKVVDELDLSARWQVDKAEAVERLKGNLTTETIQGTDLIAVRVREKDEQESREIVRKVVENYRDFRTEQERKDSAKALAELNRAVRDQEDKVEERRKVLATIVRTKGIIYKPQDSFYGQAGMDEDQGAREALQTFNELEMQKTQLESQVNTLLKYDSEELLRYASGLDLPDNVIKTVYPQYLEATRTLSELQVRGLGNRHPSVQAATDQIDGLKKQLNEGTENLKTTLQSQLKLATDRLAKVEVMKDAMREESISRGLDAQDYGDAKRDYETDQELLQVMRLEQINKTIKGRMPDETVVIHEVPEVETRVSSPAVKMLTAAKPATPSVGVNLAMAEEKSKLKEALNDKARGRMASASPAEPQSVEMKAELPALADSEPMAEMPSVPMQASGGLGGDRDKDLAMNESFAESAAPQPAAVAVLESRATRTSAARTDMDGFSAAPAAASAPPPMPTLSAKGPAEVGASMPSDRLAERQEIARKDDLSLDAILDRVGESTEHAEELAANRGRNPAKAELGEKDALLTDDVRLGLNQAEGDFNLGKYDESSRAYIEVLKKDPYNAAARRGMEKVAQAKSDYYRAAYDHTRAELLSQVDNAWELAISAEAQTAAKNMNEVLTPQPAKQPLLVEAMDELAASGDPYSTFSLNISDASFQLAKAALAKGERPDPAGIKPEQFYNAVDYGDPGPSTDEPIAATLGQSAHPILPGRNLVRVALRTASVGRATSQPLRLTLLVDQSGSMVREDRRAAMDKALQQLGSLLTKDDVVSIVGFSRTPRLLADRLSGSEGAKLGSIVNQAASEGGTNLEEAMKLGSSIAARQQLAGAQNRIVLFTDGAANLGNADPDRLAEQVKALRQKGIAFDIAGIAADGLNDRLLGDLARNGNGRYYVVGEDDRFARQLAGAFRPAAENVKVQVILNPLRVGKYKLLGFEKDRLKTEDFRNDAVDAAELAADEAGVAIYQVETLPEGKGEIGEVSVRFRDTASGEMVERSWPIPYESSVPAFDRATPSMQLAGLSLLAAEKLRGGPMAAAIDFKQLAKPMAEVRRFYQSSPRVGEMLRLIEAIR
ncbi:MAG: von Willebrand factor type A domain-containing protein [Verrucomicrobiota bacterium]